VIYHLQLSMPFLYFSSYMWLILSSHFWNSRISYQAALVIGSAIFLYVRNVEAYPPFPYSLLPRNKSYSGLVLSVVTMLSQQQQLQRTHLPTGWVARDTMESIAKTHYIR
jgi:hypothetical protein